MTIENSNLASDYYFIQLCKIGIGIDKTNKELPNEKDVKQIKQFAEGMAKIAGSSNLENFPRYTAIKEFAETIFSQEFCSQLSFIETNMRLCCIEKPNCNSAIMEIFAAKVNTKQLLEDSLMDAYEAYNLSNGSKRADNNNSMLTSSSNNNSLIKENLATIKRIIGEVELSEELFDLLLEKQLQLEEQAFNQQMNEKLYSLDEVALALPEYKLAPTQLREAYVNIFKAYQKASNQSTFYQALEDALQSMSTNTSLSFNLMEEAVWDGPKKRPSTPDALPFSALGGPYSSMDIEEEPSPQLSSKKPRHEDFQLKKIIEANDYDTLHECLEEKSQEEAKKKIEKSGKQKIDDEVAILAKNIYHNLVYNYDRKNQPGHNLFHYAILQAKEKVVSGLLKYDKGLFNTHTADGLHPIDLVFKLKGKPFSVTLNLIEILFSNSSNPLSLPYVYDMSSLVFPILEMQSLNPKPRLAKLLTTLVQAGALIGLNINLVEDEEDRDVYLTLLFGILNAEMPNGTFLALGLEGQKSLNTLNEQPIFLVTNLEELESAITRLKCQPDQLKSFLVRNFYQLHGALRCFQAQKQMPEVCETFKDALRIIYKNLPKAIVTASLSDLSLAAFLMAELDKNKDEDKKMVDNKCVGKKVGKEKTDQEKKRVQDFKVSMQTSLSLYAWQHKLLKT